MSQAHYLFGLGPARQAVPRLPAVALPAPTAIALGSLTAWVALVDPAPYRALAADPAAADRAWLIAQAQAHESICTALHLGAGGLMPCRFATLISDADALSGWITPQAALVADWLAASDGLAEMRVSAWANAENPGTPDPAPAANGAAFLAAKLATRRARQDAAERQKALAVTLARALADLAGAPDRISLAQPTPDADGRTPVLKASLLIAPARRDAIDSRLAEAAAHLGVPAPQITVSGPYAPFSFVPEGLAHAA